jgi:predicted MPP superfamily phosphohydrolase
MATVKTCLISLFIIGIALSCVAEPDSARWNYNIIMSRFCLEPSFTFGWIKQSADCKDLTVSYLNTAHSVGHYQPNLEIMGGSFWGGDLKVFYYNKKSFWGIGTGLCIFNYQMNATLDNFIVQYQGSDYYNNAFKQIITSVTPIKETLSESHFAIPLIARIKKENYKNFGIFADFGVILYDQTRIVSNTSAKFNYEAIYHRQNGSWIYDDGSNSNSDGSEVVLTKDYVSSHNPQLIDSIDNYFRELRNGPNKYNVGLNQDIKQKKHFTATHSVFTPTHSLLKSYTAAIAVNYTFNPKLSLKIGLNVVHEELGNNDGYLITDKVGSYTSLESAIKNDKLTLFGISIGVNYHIGKRRNNNNKTADYNDFCITETGSLLDKDHDGIPDRDDACPYIPGTVYSRGCPDADGDGIPDYADSAMYIPGVERLAGRPLPDDSETVAFNANEVAVDFFTFIRFAAGDSSLGAQNKEKLEILLKNGNIRESRILVFEYLDQYRLSYTHDRISKRRGDSIVDYLLRNGIEKSRIDYNVRASDVSRYRNIKIVAYGDKSPLGSEQFAEDDENESNSNYRNNKETSASGNHMSGGTHRRERQIPNNTSENENGPHGRNFQHRQRGTNILSRADSMLDITGAIKADQTQANPFPEYQYNKTHPGKETTLDRREAEERLHAGKSGFDKYIDSMMNITGNVNEAQSDGQQTGLSERQSEHEHISDPFNKLLVKPNPVRLNNDDLIKHSDSMLNETGNVSLEDYIDAQTETEKANQYSDSVFKAINKANLDAHQLNTKTRENNDEQAQQSDDIVSNLKKDLEITMEVYENATDTSGKKYAFSIPLDGKCGRSCRKEIIGKTIKKEGICPTARKIYGNKWICPDGRIIRVSISK